MIRFYYDDTLIELPLEPADLTVLDWLRVYQHRTGTKEGCGSGDCGACTVVTVRALTRADGQPELCYQAINSCITFVGALHGCQLLTVESIGTPQQLHPVQQAMVQAHASQCGFCTPGIVMSLYGLYQQWPCEERTDSLAAEHRIEQALGGNLCRCTGYQPIIAAAQQALMQRSATHRFKSEADRSHNEPDQAETLRGQQHADQALSEATGTDTGDTAAGSASDQVLWQKLIQLQQTQLSAQACNGFLQPRSADELARLYRDLPQARLLGGGTDLALEVTQQLRELPCIIHLHAVPELRDMVLDASSVTLGAAVTLAELLDVVQQQLAHRLPGVSDLLLRFGSDQVRYQGTVGGNLGSASPIGDLAPLLLVLDATLTLQQGDRLRELSLKDYFTGYRQTALQQGEFIRTVRFAIPDPGAIFAVYKVSKRREDDISSVCMAIHLPQCEGETHSARLAFGGMAATAVRALTAEETLNHRPFDIETVRLAQAVCATELQPISDARASAAYRLRVAQNLLLRVLINQTSEAVPDSANTL